MTTVGPTVLSPVRPPVPERAPQGTTPRRPPRREIQALRALAVLLVVLYHLWPGAVPGGYIGVDVFFVISGYLISGMLLRELDRDGRIRLGRFWARRARRLLPAALLTVLACAVATVIFVPLTHWQQFFTDMRAGTLYVENWQLAHNAVDYFAADDGPSPVRHFWTLSAEEQFYLAWPLLMLCGLLVRAHGRRHVLAVVLGGCAAASLAYCIQRTASDPAVAYLITPARAWEFAAGGLLALLPRLDLAPPWARIGLAWVGLGAIVCAALSYSDATAFPGWAALLPVLGTMAVIRAGTPAGRGTPGRVYALPGVQGLGAISYSVYLWHWPLLVFAPFVLGRANTTLTLAGVFVLTILLAWLSTRFVEDPIRRGVLARRPARATFLVAGLATAAVVAITVAGQAHVERRIASAQDATERFLAHKPACFGAGVGSPPQVCEDPLRVVPTPVAAAHEGNAPCTMVERRSRLAVCAFGAPSARARATFAVVGDSHASHWRAAFAPAARAEGWRGLSITRTGCPLTAASRAASERARTNCRQWNREVLDWFAAHPEVSTVYVTARAGLDVVGDSGAVARGYARAWQALPRSVKRIVVIRDTPRLRAASVDCVNAASEDGRRPDIACRVPRERALRADPQLDAIARLGSARVRAIDFTSSFCDARACYPVIGGALAFRDEDHLTPTFAATLAPLLRRHAARAAG